VVGSKERVRITVTKIPYVNHSRADPQEQHPIFLILRIEFCSNHVHRCLARAIQRSDFDIELVHKVHVAHAA